MSIQSVPNAMQSAEQAGIRQYLLTRYAGNFPRTVAVREFVEGICMRHVHLGLGDADHAAKLCSGAEPRYWQQLSEILLAHELLACGVTLQPSHNGPDFFGPASR